MIKFDPHPEIAISKELFNPSIHKTWYRYNYPEIFAAVARGEIDANQTWRQLLLNDLFFMVCFGMGIEKANHPFVVNRCHDVQDGPVSDTLDVWARYHFKSVIITQAETIQYHLKNPEHCTAIMAYVRPAGKAFLRSIKNLLEQSVLLKQCFPDILWDKPEIQAPKWSEDDGLVFKRQSSSRKESTVEAWGLTEGMPTGRHFERCVFDDIETDDIKDSPDMLDKVFSKFEMAGNLGTGSDKDIVRVIGTYYSHFGPIVRIGEKKYDDGRNMYKLRIVAGSDNGLRSGSPVLVEPNTWEKLKQSAHFNSQQLCNPTPKEDIRLDFHALRSIERQFLPKNRLKFVIIDPAGDDAVTKGSNGNDNWAIGCISVEPVIDDLGMSKVFIEDIEYGRMALEQAIDAGVLIHTRNGRITGTGIERVGTDTTYDHIIRGLHAKRRRAVLKKTERDGGNVVLLSPDGKKKEHRIESSLSWPWNNGMIYYSTDLDTDVLKAIKEECDKFPFYHVDILDMISYIYKLLEKMKFSFYLEENEDEDEPVYSPSQEGRSLGTGY